MRKTALYALILLLSACAPKAPATYTSVDSVPSVYILPETIRIRRRMTRLVHARIDMASKMFDKNAEHRPLHVTNLIIFVCMPLSQRR